MIPVRRWTVTKYNLQTRTSGTSGDLEVKRMSPATLTLLMLLIIGGLVVVYVGKKLLARDEAPPVDQLIDVPMAIADLEPGTLITKQHLAIGKLLQSKLTRDIVKSDRVLLDRVVKTKIKAAQAISTLDLYAPNDGPPLDISPGMRAVTISLADGTAAVDGLVKPGNYVDIHFVPAWQRDAARNGGMIMTLFKGVRVIALNRSVSGSNEPAVARGQNTVTLEMTPDHANILLLASKKGQMTLVYTPDGKAENQFALREQDRAYLDEILGLKPLEPKKSEEIRPTVTELFSGASRRLQTFKDGLRSDRYAIERFDYNRPAYANGYGYGNDYYGGYNGNNDPPPPPMDRRRDDYGYGGGYGGGNGGYGNGYGNGLYSVPQGAVGDSTAGFGGVGAAGGGGGSDAGAAGGAVGNGAGGGAPEGNP